MTNHDVYMRQSLVDREPCASCLYSGPDMQPCAVDECTAVFHRSCGKNCEGCNKPVCDEHAETYQEHTYCPACFEDVEHCNPGGCVEAA